MVQIGHGPELEIRKGFKCGDHVGARACTDGGEALDFAQLTALVGLEGVEGCDYDPIGTRVVNLNICMT